MSSILVYIDHFGGAAKPVSWEILGKARELAGKLGVPVAAFIAGQNWVAWPLRPSPVAPIRCWSLTVRRSLSSTRRRWPRRSRRRSRLPNRASSWFPPRPARATWQRLVACELNIGMAADCQGLDLDGAGNLLAERPVFSGNIMTTVVFNGPVQMATVRARSFPLPAADSSRAGEIVPLVVSVPGDAEEVLSFEVTETGELAVENAGIIVSGGRGVKGPEGFAPIRDLAKVLGGAVGASRAAVDAGWIPYPHQVGQTGKSVRPDLYIACGISGAIQHLAGMSGAKVIVAINKDKDAPIFTVARYGIVGDLFEVVPALTTAFKAKLGR